MRRPALYALLLLPALAAAAQDAQTTAREALASLAAEEAKAPQARLTISLSERRGEKKGIETESETRKRIAATPAGTAEGSVAYGADGWCKEMSVPPSGQNPRPMRVRTAESGLVLRNLIQVTEAGKEQAFGRVIKINATAPADAILTRRAARALQGVTWTVSRSENGLVTLEGKRGEEHHTISLALQPAAHITNWKLSRTLTSPEGRTILQDYECRAESGADGQLTRIEEWMSVGSPLNTVTQRITEVKKTDPAANLKPEELRIRFPKGTQVVDARGEIPLEYEQTAEGVNEDEVARAAQALADGRARVGDPAPAFELKDAKGNFARLGDFKGSVLVLYWFNTLSRPSQESAGAIQDLEEKYRKRNVTIVGVNIGEEGDAGDRLEAFRKRYKWKFPVVLDPQGEAMHRYGLVAAVPKIAIVDRDGKIAYVQPGADIDAVTAVLEKLAGPAN